MTDSIQLPRELAERLTAFERRLRRVETRVAALAGLAGALCTLALLAMLDRLGDTPAAVRVALATVGAAAAAAAAGWWARHWLFRRRDARELARLVQRAYPGLGDRLLGAVELASHGGEVAGASPALLRAALRQVAAESRSYDFIRAAPTRAARRYAAALAGVLAVLGAVAVFAPDALRQSIRRWLHPSAPVERYTFTRLSELPDEWVVPRGEPFELEIRIEEQSRWRPSTARARIGDQPVVRADVSGGRARFRFPGQLEPAPLSIRAGDAGRRLTILPLARPELTGFTARVEWPGYLRREPETVRIERGRLTLPLDARVSFEGIASRSLGAARLRFAKDETEGGGEEIAVEAGAFRSPTRSVSDWIRRYASESARSVALAFEWSDPHGLRQTRPYRLELAAIEDAPPEVRITETPLALAVLEEEAIVLRVRGSDDFGLAAIGTEWSLEATRSADAPEAADAPAAPRRMREKALEQDTTGQQREMDATHRLSPLMMGAAPGTTIRLNAWAADAYPNRDRSRSEIITLHVLSNEEHARLILQQMAELSARLEEALREEERLLAAHEALHSLDDEALANARSEALLERGRESEQQNAAETESIARDAENLMREALRNPVMKSEDIQPWMQAAERLKETSSEHMKPAAGALGQAAARPPERRESLSEAAEHERKAVEELRRAAQETSQAMESTEARNFIGRLRELAEQERQVGSDMVDFMPGMIGINASELDPAQRSAAAVPRGLHTRARREAGYVRDDLGAFYTRTRQEIYERIRLEMSEPDVLGQFDVALRRMDANQLMMASTELEALAARFEAWADALESSATPPQGGDGGGGGGEQQGLEPDILFGLMRARVQEEMLREQTRAADEGRDSETYAGAVKLLSKRQRDIGRSLFTMSYQTRMEQAAQMMRSLADVSDEVASDLDRPDTGAPALGGQTQIIETIARMMQGQRGSSSAQPSESQEPGDPQPGETAGPTGGRGARDSGGGVGTPDSEGGRSEDSSTGGRATGGDPATWPAEYRDAIQRYYEAMEGEP